MKPGVSGVSALGLLLLRLPVQCSSASSAASQPFAKRGYVADGEKGEQSCDDPLLLGNANWFYEYNVWNPYRQPGLTGNCAQMNATGNIDERFVPMNWCLSSMDTPIPAYADRGIFMGFNEPNNRHNCNTSARLVAEAWGEVMKKHPDSTLVSPGMCR